LDNSIENPLFWTFTSSVSCNYNITISACGCSGGAGGCSGGNFGAYQADGALPAGNITSYFYQDNFFGSNGNGAGCACSGASCCETLTFTAAVTANQPVYLVFDGNAGSVCNFSISVTQGSGCASCTILSSIDNGFTSKIIRDKGFVFLEWSSEPNFNGDYILEKSYDNVNFSFLANLKNVNPNGNTIKHNYKDYALNDGYDYIYYRLKRKSISEIEFSGIRTTVVNLRQFKEAKVVSQKVYDVFGKEYMENNLPSGMVIYVTEFEDGTKIIEKKFKN
jgi:hypothetical protein